MDRMKKQDKTDLTASCIGTHKILRVYLKYDEGYYTYYYPHAVNEHFLLGQVEHNFQLDGYHIRKVSDLVKVEVKDDLCEQINIWNGVVNGIKDPGIDISSWQSIFRSLAQKERLITVQDDYNDVYILGKIKKVCARHVVLISIDADGIIQDEPFIFPYARITDVEWDTRYTENWYQYLKSENPGLLD